MSQLDQSVRSELQDAVDGLGIAPLRDRAGPGPSVHMTGERPQQYVPPLVTEWSALDTDIDAFIGEFGKAPGTVRSHAQGWATWASHCQALGVDPLAAPFSAFEDLLLRRRSDGHAYARGSHDIVLGAVGATYAEAGVVPAHKLPANVSSWKALLRGASREAGTRKRSHPASAEQWEVEPLLRPDLVAMLTATLRSTTRIQAVVASVLLAIDSQMASRELARLGTAEVELLPHGVQVGGQTFPCRHAELVPGVPWDCTSCAIRAVVEAHPGAGPLFVAASEGDLVAVTARRLRALRDRPWGGAEVNRATGGWRSTRLTPAEDLSDWQAAGFRRACVLLAGRHGEGGTWVRARAWTALAWSCGFRMCGDLLRLDRKAVFRDAGGQGYRIALAGTKDDPRGEKQVVRPVAWGDGPVSAASLVAEYLCVRDAVHGPGGKLIVADVLSRRDAAGTGLANGGQGGGGGTGTARKDLGLLCDLAQITDHRYSSKSTRKGFAEQARRDGWTVEAIRDALRHQSLGVTLNSYLSASAAQDVSTTLIRSLARTPQ